MSVNTPASVQAAAQLLSVSAPPHSRSTLTLPRIMVVTLAALMPAAAVACLYSGVHALLIMVCCCLCSTTAEWLIVLVRDRRLRLIDGSACVTGLLLAFSLPPQIPLRAAAVAAVFAIAFAKFAAGGLGRNFLNPALAGRALLVLAMPAAFAAPAGLTEPTAGTGSHELLFNLLLGHQCAWTGGTSTAALLLGAAVLMVFGIIDIALPVAALGTSFALFWLFGGTLSPFSPAAFTQALLWLIGCGALPAALFMATDPVTSPKAGIARLLSGACCGILIFIFCKFGAFSNGAMYAVLLMNCAVPWLDRYCRPKPFGASARPALSVKST